MFGGFVYLARSLQEADLPGLIGIMIGIGEIIGKDHSSVDMSLVIPGSLKLECFTTN